MTTASGPTLSISVRHLHAVERHAVVAYPEECCGVLVGRLEEEGPRGDPRDGESPGGAERVQVHRVLPARNDEPDRPSSRYTIAPETVLAARREAKGDRADHSYQQQAAHLRIGQQDAGTIGENGRV